MLLKKGGDRCSQNLLPVELAKAQLNDPEKILMVSLAARIVSVQAVALSECDKRNCSSASVFCEVLAVSIPRHQVFLNLVLL